MLKLALHSFINFIQMRNVVLNIVSVSLSWMDILKVKKKLSSHVIHL